MERLEADFLIIDLVAHGAPAAYVLGRLAGIDIRSMKKKEVD